MSKPYKVVGPRPVNDAKPGQEFEAEFSASEESDLVEAGRIEVIAREYLNVGSQVVCGAEPGKKFNAVMPLSQEAALIEGGHIELVTKRGASAPANARSK